MRASARPHGPKIPVAALPARDGEVNAVYRSKRRPAVVISSGGTDLPPEVRRGLGWQVHRAVTVAPYYGVEHTDTRQGWPQSFVDRIARAEYPQYAYDKLPIGGTEESILRLDHLQPIGDHHESYELTPYVLSDDALIVLDEWLVWLFTGQLSKESVLRDLRDGLYVEPAASTPPPTLDS